MVCRMTKNLSSPKLERILVLLLVILVVFLIFLLGVLTLTVFLRQKNKVDPSEDVSILTHEYQILEYDSLKSEYSTGIISTFGLLEDDYKFTRIEGGKYELISKFGADEYECTGLCYCDVPSSLDDGRRSNTGISLLQKPIFYLAAAMTSTIAYGLAKNYFENECLDELEGECDSALVSSEVSECDVLTNEDTEESSGYWICDGHCLTMPSCSDYVFEIEYEYGQENPMVEYATNRIEGCTSITCSGNVRGITMEEEAKENFLKKHLKHTCLELSKMKTIHQQTLAQSQDAGIEKKMRVLYTERSSYQEEIFEGYTSDKSISEDQEYIDDPSWCVADIHHFLDNIKCRKTFKKVYRE